MKKQRGIQRNTRKKILQATVRKRNPVPNRNPFRLRKQGPMLNITRLADYIFANEAAREKSLMRHAWYRNARIKANLSELETTI